jgi:hypothetical protein
MVQFPFVSRFGIRHGIQTIRLSLTDVHRLTEDVVVLEVDVLGEYVAHISFDPSGEGVGEGVADLDAEFFAYDSWQFDQASDYLTAVNQVAGHLGEPIDEVRKRIRDAGFAISEPHPESGWPFGAVITAEVSEILNVLSGESMRGQPATSTAPVSASQDDGGAAVAGGADVCASPSEHGTAGDQIPDQHADGTAADRVAEIQRLLEDLDDVSLEDQDGLYFQHGYGELNLAVRDLLRMIVPQAEQGPTGRSALIMSNCPRRGQ